MKKLTKKQTGDFLAFLNDNKYLVGLQGWTIKLKEEVGTDNDFAECEPNIFEQILTVTINQSFLDVDAERQSSILIHELLHGRVDIHKKIVDELTDFEEERLVNDLERGMFALYKLGVEDEN